MSYDPVEHPEHYNTHPSGIACIEIIRWWPCNISNAMKYLWRAGKKGESLESALQDLDKASWYINDELRNQRMVYPRLLAPVIHPSGHKIDNIIKNDPYWLAKAKESLWVSTLIGGDLHDLNKALRAVQNYRLFVADKGGL